MLNALIFDVDGTLADTEEVHRQAFNAAFAEAGLGWHWDRELYAKLLLVAGGKERMRHYWQGLDPKAAAGSGGRVERIHAIKTRHYTEIVESGGVPLRPGILRLIGEAADAGLRMAIATTTTPDNVDALLRGPLGPGWRGLFEVVQDGASCPVKKPAPDVYRAVLAGLGLPASDCIALEDSENGLRAASAAGIATIVTPTAYTAGHRFDGALLVLPHLGDPEQPMCQLLPGADRRWVNLAALRRWHEGTLFESA